MNSIETLKTQLTEINNTINYTRSIAHNISIGLASGDGNSPEKQEALALAAANLPHLNNLYNKVNRELQEKLAIAQGY